MAVVGLIVVVGIFKDLKAIKVSSSQVEDISKHIRNVLRPI
ncbi:MAG: hypothetical protein ACTSVI_16060 [Promethearchaeota archaeon]